MRHEVSWLSCALTVLGIIGGKARKKLRLTRNLSGDGSRRSHGSCVVEVGA